MSIGRLQPLDMATPRSLALGLILFLSAAPDYGCSKHYDPSSPGVVTVYDVKVDICYWVTSGKWPHWLTHNQINYRIQLAPKVFPGMKMGAVHDGSLIRACANYKATVLNPDHNAADYELCWFAKNGVWKTPPKDNMEKKHRKFLVEEYLYENNKKLSGWKLHRLCPNIYQMKCMRCYSYKEKNCFYARFGRWKSKAPPIASQRSFFYNKGGRRLTKKELAKKCPQYLDKKCKAVFYPDCGMEPSGLKY